MEHTFSITAAGAFSLRQSIQFLHGFTPLGYDDNGGGTPNENDVLRLAFGVEGHPLSVGVSVRQPSASEVTVTLDDVADGPVHEVDHTVLAAQTARILSLDVDATGLRDALHDDQHALALADRLPGLRPVCFHSPYEAAAWAILTQRIQRTQAARIRLKVARQFGTEHEVAGQTIAAFPRPEVLLKTRGLEELVPDVKVARLQAVARAALDGALDGDRLRSLDTDVALAELRAIDGVGPFSAELILVRGAGHPDRFPRTEARLHQEMSQVYGVPKDDVGELERIAAHWRPFRSWVSFYYRAQAGAGVSARGR